MLPMENISELIQLQLDTGGRARLIVTGMSMYPMLCNCRDSVELVQAIGKQKRRDIILYKRDNGQYILHRIIGLSEDGYICSGDNQIDKEQVRQDQVLAVVSGFTRKGKTYPVDHTGYRFYAATWVGLFPIRRYLLALGRHLSRIKQKLRRWKV